MKTIKTNAVITSFRSKVDKSLSFTTHTPELTSKEKATFMDLQGASVAMLIEPLDETPKGIEKIDKDLETKTKSQRLRSVLYVYWKQTGQKDSKFEDFYNEKMEKLIEHYKSKLI